MFVFISTMIISCAAQSPELRMPDVTGKSLQGADKGKVVREANSVLVGIYCRADDWFCYDHIRQRLDKTLIRAGYKPIAKKIDKAAEYPERIEGTMDAAEYTGAAFVILLKIDARWMYDFDGEFFSEANGQYRLMDAADGKVLTTQETGWKKASSFGQQNSLKNAIDKVFNDLTARIEKGTR